MADDTNYTIGDKTYSEEDLRGLITDGEYKREIEAKQNTSIDRVQAEYTKLSQKAKEWEAEREEYLRLKEEANRPKDLDETTINQAKAEAKKLGLLTEDTIDEYIGKKFPTLYATQRSAERLIETSENLEKEYNGEDGRPKFNTEEILTYMRDTGIREPMQAYKLKYESELDEWKTQKLSEAKRDNIPTESSSTAGAKQPKEVKASRDNISQLLKEALQGA